MNRDRLANEEEVEVGFQRTGDEDPLVYLWFKGDGARYVLTIDQAQRIAGQIAEAARLARQ